MIPRSHTPPSYPSSFWRRTGTALLVVVVAYGLMSAVGAASFGQIVSSGMVGEGLRQMSQELEGLGGAAGLGSNVLGELLGNGGQGGTMLGSGQAEGFIRGLKRLPAAVTEGVESMGKACSWAALAFLLVALCGVGGLVLLSGVRAAGEGLALGLMITGVSCLVVGGVSAIVGGRIATVLGELGEVPTTLAQGLIRQFQGFQLEVGVAFILFGGTGAILLSFTERSTAPVSPPRRW